MKRYILIVVALTLGLSAFADGVERASLLPGDAIVVVRVEDTSDLVSAVKKSSLGKLWQDAQIQDFLGKQDLEKMVLDGMIKKDGEEAAHLLWDQMKMLSGEVILGFRADNDEPYIVAYITDEDFAKTLVMDDRINEVTKGSKMTIKKTRFQGVQLIEHIRVDPKKKDAEPRSSWQACVQNTLLVAENRQWVEKSIVALKNGQIKEPEGGKGRIKVTVDVRAILKKIADEEAAARKKVANEMGMDPTAGGASSGAAGFFESSGLMGIDKVTADVTLDDEQAVAEVRLAVRKLNQGLFRILDARPSSLDLRESFVPADAVVYEVGRIDFGELWRAIPTVLLAAAGQGGVAQFSAIVQMVKGALGVDPESDLIAHLGTQYVRYAGITDGQLLGTAALRLKNAEAMKTSLATIFTKLTTGEQPMMAETLKAEEFRGTTMYALQRGQLPVKIAVAVAGGYLLWGSDVSVRDALRALANPVAAAGNAFYSSKEFKELRRNVPAGSFGYGVVDWPAIVKGVLTEDKRLQFINGLRSGINMSRQRTGQTGRAPDIFSKMDATKFPPASHVASFFGPSFSFMKADGGNLRWRLILRYQARD